VSDDKPTVQRHQERKQEKGQGRDRRAELLLDTRTKEAARQDLLEGRVGKLEARVLEVERRLAVVEHATPPSPTTPPGPANPAQPNQLPIPNT
jgi:hypothetical protein